MECVRARGEEEFLGDMRARTGRRRDAGGTAWREGADGRGGFIDGRERKGDGGGGRRTEKADGGRGRAAGAEDVTRSPNGDDSHRGCFPAFGTVTDGAQRRPRLQQRRRPSGHPMPIPAGALVSSGVTARTPVK